jgi:hypothetical protein
MEVKIKGMGMDMAMGTIRIMATNMVATDLLVTCIKRTEAILHLEAAGLEAAALQVIVLETVVFPAVALQEVHLLVEPQTLFQTLKPDDAFPPTLTPWLIFLSCRSDICQPFGD